MKLTDTKIKNATAREKPYKLFDGRGLFLLVNTNGSKWWRFKYRRIDGKENQISFGVYPEVSLKDARDRLYQARKSLDEGVDPSVHRQAIKDSRLRSNENTFEVMAREWHSNRITTWSKDHGEAILERLEKDLFPYIGSKPITHITPQDLIKALKKVQDRDAIETAHRLLQYCTQICEHSMVTGRLDRDFTVGIKKVLKPVQKRHFAAITDPQKLAQFLRDIDYYRGNELTKLGLKLAPLVFLRPGELRKAEWQEFNFEQREWHIPAERMKMKVPHIVPLSTQAMAILNEIFNRTGHGKYVFPGTVTVTRPMSNNTINTAIRRLGYTKDDMTGHGFRATARTILDEVLNQRLEYIEHQLAHKVKDPNGRAYNRTKHLPQRHEMMQVWADYLDKIKKGEI